MWPSPWASRIGRKVCTPCTTPKRFTSTTQRQVGMSHGGPWPPTPALLHTTCTAPKRSSAAWARASTEAGSVTSVGTASTSVPAAANRSVVEPSGPASTSAPTIDMPCAANASHNAAPMPLPAPVTTATRPLSCSMSVSPPCCAGPSVKGTAPDPGYVAQRASHEEESRLGEARRWATHEFHRCSAGLSCTPA